MITLNSAINRPNNKVTFTAMATKLPYRRIKGASDAIAQWELMRHPKYSAIWQEEEACSQSQRTANREIRNQNYAFLDELTWDSDKKQFIEYFRNLTGFPSLERCTQKILEEFRRVLNLASDNEVLMSGYDEFCSVGQRSALPGSDLDKGFAIVKGTSWGSQKSHSDRVKGRIWDNIDNRIMSVNHTAAFPNVMTDKELEANIHYFDKVAKQFVTPENLNFFRWLRLENGNPISGSKFNIWLSERLSSKSDRYDAKNLAYIVEAMRDGKKLDFSYIYEEPMFRLFENSEFCHCSNITQGKQMQYKYDYGNMQKKKLRARQQVENAFSYWSTSKQYELVKDIIRSMSGDSKNPEFKDLFHSATDRHRLLINDILRGRVGCSFERTEYGERATLFFKDAEMAAKYSDLNVYSPGY